MTGALGALGVFLTFGRGGRARSRTRAAKHQGAGSTSIRSAISGSGSAASCSNATSASRPSRCIQQSARRAMYSTRRSSRLWVPGNGSPVIRLVEAPQPWRRSKRTEPGRCVDDLVLGPPFLAVWKTPLAEDARKGDASTRAFAGRRPEIPSWRRRKKDAVVAMASRCSGMVAPVAPPEATCPPVSVPAVINDRRTQVRDRRTQVYG